MVVAFRKGLVRSGERVCMSPLLVAFKIREPHGTHVLRMIARCMP
jgi:hypothetical protein